MSTIRAYTWCVITYAKPKDFQRLLDSAMHWAYAYHDKDWRFSDEGEKIPKEPHYHVLLAFENEQSLKQLKERIDSTQNVFGQRLHNKAQGKESVRGIWDYLTHRDEDPNEKFIYDESIRISDDLSYWEKRCQKELLSTATNDSFFEDLLSDDFNLKDMGRKYGRDFIKNHRSYLEYRRNTLQEQEYLHNKELWQELEQFCTENMISWEDARTSLMYISVELHARREADKLFNIKTGY